MADDTPPKRKRGRPRKSELLSKSKGKRGAVGRPKGDAAILNEYKARMLSSPKSKAVLAKVLDVALDDEHKHQAACMKMVVDRILPSSYFEKDKLGGGVGGININITGLGAEVSSVERSEEEVEEAEYTEVASEEDSDE